MIADYDISKRLSNLGFHCKSFWVYIDGKKTHTGFDGFDEGEFEFINNNFLDPTIKEDLEQLMINKQFDETAYPQRTPEIIVAPEHEDVLMWLDSLGIFVSIDCKGDRYASFSVSSNNSSVHCNRSSRIEAVHDAIAEALTKLEKYARK